MVYRILVTRGEFKEPIPGMPNTVS